MMPKKGNNHGITLINSHVHSNASDGSLTPEEMVKEAISAGVNYLCFCDHYKRPEAFRKSKQSFDYESYVNEIKRLQKAYRDRVEIAFGTEVDWLEQYKDWTANEIKNYGARYDLIIGSVHYIWDGDEYVKIYGTLKTWEGLANKIGLKRFIKEYYHQMRLMMKSGLFTCVGHFDMVKIFNKDSRLFDEQEEWYRHEVLKALDEARKAKICIELNTHGFQKDVGAQYPSEWILKEMNKRGIPITISSDAHRTGDVKDHLAEAIALAKKAGYHSVVKFKDRKMIQIRI